MSTIVDKARKTCLVAVVVLLNTSACDNASDVQTVNNDPVPILTSVSYEYDELNRLTAVRYSNGDVMRYTYDEAGNILTVEMDKAE